MQVHEQHQALIGAQVQRLVIRQRHAPARSGISSFSHAQLAKDMADLSDWHCVRVLRKSSALCWIRARL